MSRIVVTVATGRLGANVVKRLSESGHEVAACMLRGDGQEPKLDGLAVQKVYVDILDTEGMARAIRGADAVVHSAAVMENVMGKMAPAKFFDINVKGAFNVLEGVRQSGKATRLICLSSTSVYDVFTSSRKPIKENQERKPLSLYGMNKILIEEQVRQYHWQYDIPFTLIRPNYIVAGPEVLNVFTCGVVLEMLTTFGHQKKTQLYCESDPEGWKKARPVLEENKNELCVPRCPGGQSWRWHMTDVRDAVALIEVCLTNAIGQTFNVAAADPCDWPKVVPYIAECTGRKVVEVEIPNLWQFCFDQSGSKKKLGFVSGYNHKDIVDTACAMSKGQEVGIIPGEIAPLAFEGKGGA